MKSRVVFAIAFSLVLATSPSASAQDECVDLPSGSATINGSVKSAVNAQAVFATVTATAEIAGYGIKSFDTITSFLDGSFSLQVAAPATYVVTAAPFDQVHAPEFYNGVLTKAAAQEFSLTDGQTVNGVNFTVVVGTTLSGTVTAQQGGAAIADVMVQALPLGDLFHLAVGQTDASGDYTISGLALQDYQVSFFPEQSAADYLIEVYDDKN